RQIKAPFFLRHLEDREVFNHVQSNAATQMTASKLTSFLVDTGACYHMGSRVAPDHTRLMYTALYTSYPFIFPEAKENNFTIVGPVSPLQRMALLLGAGARMER